MGNLGMPELIFILLIALLIFGPKKLPEIGKQVGRALGEFKRAGNDLKRSLEEEVERVNAEERSAPAESAPTPVPASQTVAANAPGPSPEDASAAATHEATPAKPA